MSVSEIKDSLKRFGRVRLLLPLILVAAGSILAFPYIAAGVDIALSSAGLRAAAPPSVVTEKALTEVKGDRIVIPAIELDSPLTSDLGELDRKVVHYSFSSQPGEGGNSVITAHNYRKYGNPLFSLLFMLDKKSEVLLSFGGKKVVYQVSRKVIVSPKEAADYATPTDAEQLTMITCYPPTIDTMRLVIVASPKQG